MIEIKSDFHLHTSEDREDPIAHSARELIDYAADRNITAIAITNHNTFTYNQDLARHAEDKGVLLIPGVEKSVEHKHVLILNAFPATEKIKSFDDLRKAKEDGVFLIAPHPFYKTPPCLGRKLYEHLELFDALEFSYFYATWLNPNKQMLRLAEESGLPVVGNSDCHLLKYFAACHSILQADELSTASIFSAIREKRIDVVTKPTTVVRLASIFFEMKWSQCQVAFRAQKRPKFYSPEAQPEKMHI
ncbi:MAG: PHP-associated domain-containing protein [bacterium]